MKYVSDEPSDLSCSMFMNPRTTPITSEVTSAQVTGEPKELTELHRTCHDNRIYKIEHSIQVADISGLLLKPRWSSFAATEVLSVECYLRSIEALFATFSRII